MASLCVMCGAVVMVTMMLVLLQRSVTADEMRSSSSRGRSPSSSSYRGSNRGRGIGGISGPSGNQARLQDHDLPYSTRCPVVYCAQLPRDCQTIEFIVFEVQDNDIGRGLVTVRCRSCEYCLDPPTRTIATRGIRNYGNRQEVKEMSPCSMVQCPMLPENCIDIRLTNVLVGGQQCDQCPACYDHTFIDSL